MQKVTYEMGPQFVINENVVTEHFVAVVIGIHLKHKNKKKNKKIKK